MLKDVLLGLANESGVLIKKNFTMGMKKEWKDEDNSPVTATDEEINQRVIELVGEIFPDDTVLGEEDSTEIKKGEYVWVLDPIDGTFPFSHGIPTCVFSLAVCKDGQPVAAVIYDPFMERMFYAEKGSGTEMNGELVYVSSRESLEKAKIGVSPIYTLKTEYQIRPALEKMLSDHTVQFIDVMSIVYLGMLVAAGELDACIFTYKKPYDGAALKLIVEEAGGCVTDLYGKEQRYDEPIRGFIASNRHVHAEVVNMIAPCLR